jgi:hypothetical protein
MNLNESTVEAAALEWSVSLGYAVGHGPDLAPGEPAAESACAPVCARPAGKLHAERRDSFGEVVLVGRLSEAFREGARAKIRVIVKRVLRKHGYPPDLKEGRHLSPRQIFMRRYFDGLLQAEMLLRVVAEETEEERVVVSLY